MNNELIEKMKKNERPFGLLSKAEQECLRENAGHVHYYFGAMGWQPDYDPTWCISIAYRIDPDYEPEGRWVEYPIFINKSNQYYINAPAHFGVGCCETIYLYELPRFVGFGGVQYENESDNSWNTYVSAIARDNHTYQSVTDREGNMKPATPIKARFWVES